MPLVLTQNEVTESGHSYEDVLGVVYEYPSEYRRLVQPGARFIYYRSRGRASGPNQPQTYLGSGVIADVEPSGTDGRLVSRIVDYEAFPEPIFFKEGDDYLERGAAQYGSNAGLYFRRGVREIDEATFARILRLGGGSPGERRPDLDVSDYASPELALAVDELAMEFAERHLNDTHPDATVTPMPHNNPGFDILLEHEDGTESYVEVKGTSRSWPHFFLSEGQRRFSVLNSENFVLLVCHSIDLGERTGSIETWPGEISPEIFVMRAMKWEVEPLGRAHITSLDRP